MRQCVCICEGDPGSPEWAQHYQGSLKRKEGQTRLRKCGDRSERLEGVEEESTSQGI